VVVRTETAEQRFSIYRGLVARNRLVTILRIATPLLGLLAFAGFMLPIFLSALIGGFSIGNVSISGDAITFARPSYSGMLGDGSVYAVSADAATGSVGNPNVIALKNAQMKVTRKDGSVMAATAAAGDFDMITQTMTVKGSAEITDSAGNSGTLSGLVVKLDDQKLVANGPSHIVTQGGMTIDSQHVVYDGKTLLWDFGRATVVLPQTPGNDEADQPAGTP
jgi:hypothetical protein